MAIILEKGQRISLSKEAPNLRKLMCGLGWDVAKSSKGGLFKSFGSNNHEFDLDASVICLNSSDKLVDKKNIVYFANLQHSSGAIIHQGDNLTGAGAGDDEVIIIDLPSVPEAIAKLVFVINIYQPDIRHQDFGQVENAFVRLVDLANNKELARYNLSGKDYEGKTSMILAEVYRHQNEWKMAAIGNGLNLVGLEKVALSYF